MVPAPDGPDDTRGPIGRFLGVPADEVRGSPWSEAFTLEEIHADGLTVIATLHSTVPGGVRTVLGQRDNLLTFG